MYEFVNCYCAHGDGEGPAEPTALHLRAHWYWCPYPRFYQAMEIAELHQEHNLIKDRSRTWKQKHVIGEQMQGKGMGEVEGE